MKLCIRKEFSLGVRQTQSLKQMLLQRYWWNDDVFPPCEYTFDSILNVAHLVDAGIFILAEDDILCGENGKKTNATTRDNVLIEAGVFYGVLGKNGVGLCAIDNPKMPSDWLGINIIKYKEDMQITLEEKIKIFLDNVERKNNKKPNNVHMQARREIHKQYPLRHRLGSDSSVYKNIVYVRILNIASSLIVNPSEAEYGHKKQDTHNLSEIIYTILRDTNAWVQLVLADPTNWVVNDAKSKIANPLGAEAIIFSAQSRLYDLLTGNDVYIKALQERRFQYRVTDIAIPFVVFAVEYDYRYSYLNHVKIDLYSAALTDEDSRRSMVIWQRQDNENYDFFLQNFKDIISNSNGLSRIPSIDQMMGWLDKRKI